MLPEKVKKLINEYDMIKAGDRIVAGVWGERTPYASFMFCACCAKKSASQCVLYMSTI